MRASNGVLAAFSTQLVTMRLSGPLALSLALAIAEPIRAQAAPDVVAITNVTVIDVTSGPPRSNVTVLIAGDRITAVSAAASVRVPAAAVRIDGRGRFVIPGLWDAHAHLGAGGREALLHFVRFGVTSVRDLGGRLDSVLVWRRDIERGALIGPRVKVAGPIVENAAWLRRVGSLPIPGMASLAAERFGIETPDDAVRVVDSMARLNVDLLKLRNAPRAETFEALLTAARSRGLPTAGHQPSSAIGLGGAFRAGLRSIEHIEGLGALETMRPAERDSLVILAARVETWITPTLIASFQRFRPDSVTTALVDGTDTSPHRELVSGSLRTFWAEQHALKQFDAPLDSYRQMVTTGLAGMRRLTSGGVKLLAGTDFATIGSYPGPTLHDELALMVDSLGLTPSQALAAATIEPARYFGIADRLGTVEVGKLADLVVLDGNPIGDIRQTQRIHAVIARGRVVARR